LPTILSKNSDACHSGRSPRGNLSHQLDGLIRQSCWYRARTEARRWCCWGAQRVAFLPRCFRKFSLHAGLPTSWKDSAMTPDGQKATFDCYGLGVRPAHAYWLSLLPLCSPNRVKGRLVAYWRRGLGEAGSECNNNHYCSQKSNYREKK
jgi:hypothetical protein